MLQLIHLKPAYGAMQIYCFIIICNLQLFHKLITQHSKPHNSSHLTLSLSLSHTHAQTSETQGVVTFPLCGMLCALEQTMLNYWHSESRKKPKARERTHRRRQRETNEMISWSANNRDNILYVLIIDDMLTDITFENTIITK